MPVERANQAPPNPLAWARLFRPGPHQFALGLAKLAPAEFFAPQTGGQLLAERRALLQERSGAFLGELGPGDLSLVASFAAGWLDGSPEKSLVELGGAWEPDFVLLELPSLVVLGGCVCFPTGWSLPAKIGQPVELVHTLVPGLNQELGDRIAKLLRGLPEGEAFQRTNWGLSSSDCLDQSPDRGVPAISAEFAPAATYLRLEWQALVRFRPDRLLFAIRVFHRTLASLRAEPVASHLLAENLRTMSAAILDYKRLNEARDAIVAYLEAS